MSLRQVEVEISGQGRAARVDGKKVADPDDLFGGLATVAFTPDDPVGLVNFVLQRNIPPEVGVYRRSALLRAQTPASRTLPFHAWMYALSRLGRLRFDPTAFYREHRVLKPRLQLQNAAPAFPA